MRRALVCVAAVLLLAGCGGPFVFDGSIPVTVVSREDGSGTRGAFTELFGVEKDGYDATTPEAVTISNTAVMLSTVASNPYAIGYVSLGSLTDEVKPVSIGGVAPTAAHVLDGSYLVSRPFLLATQGAAAGAAADFIAFILSAEGQAVVEKAGYVPLPDAAPFAGDRPPVRVVVAGSSSVTPVMEKLREAYQLANPEAKVEIQQSDSSTGVAAVTAGIADIAMVSRALTDSEAGAGVSSFTMAMDGLAVIVNPQNPIGDLSPAAVQAIYLGEAATWDAVAAVHSREGTADAETA